MDYNSSLWDFARPPSGFTQLPDSDFLALLEKQFNPDAATPDAFAVSHDGVDPSKITNLPAPAPLPPLSEDSSPSPPSTTDRASSSRRQSTNSAFEQDAHELKRKASPDDMEDDSPSQKSCMYCSVQIISRTDWGASLSQKVSCSEKIGHLSGERRPLYFRRLMWSVDQYPHTG
jgi:AP-1-like factor